MARAALNAIMNFFKRQVNMARIYSARCCFTLALILAVVSIGVSGFDSKGLSTSSHNRVLDVSPVSLLSVGGTANPGQPGGGFVTPGGNAFQYKQSFTDSSPEYATIDDVDPSSTDQTSPSAPTPSTLEDESPIYEEIPGDNPEENKAPATPPPMPFEEDEVSAPPQSSPQQDQGLSTSGGPSAESQETQEKDSTVSFLNEINQEIMKTSQAALEAPAAYCAGEGEETGFCHVLREFAATLRTSVGFLSMLQIPTQEEVTAREAQAAEEYNERVRQAAARAQPRLEQAGSSGSTERLSSAVSTYYKTYAILHAYILTTSAKILLETVKSTLVGAQSQVVVSTSELYSSLLTSLPGALASARHFMEFVMIIIEGALRQISSDTSNAQVHANSAFVKLSDLEALVSHTAKRKADLTLTLDRPANEIDNIIKSEMDFTVSGSLEAPMQRQIVERALSVINSNSEASSQVTYYLLSGAQGEGIPVPPQAAPGFPPQAAPGFPPQAARGFPPQAAPGFPPQAAPGFPPQAAPGFPPPQFGVPGPQGFRGPAEFAPPRAPTPEAAPTEMEGAAKPPAPEMMRPEMKKAEDVARRREEESIRELGKNLAEGSPQFHSAPADYIMEAQGTSSAACQTDFTLAAPTEEEKRSGVLPRSCGDRAAKAVESLVTHQLKPIERPPLRLFATQFDIEAYVKELWQAEKKRLMDEASPAPSFYTLVSTGCASTSSDLTRQFWQAWKDRDLFRNVAGNSVQSERLRKRVQILTQSVLASFMFSTDHTLMVLEAMMKRAVGYAISFMEKEEPQGQLDADQMPARVVSRKEALNGSLELFGAYKKLKGGKKDPFDTGLVNSMLQHLQATSQFIKVLASDNNTKHLMGLLIHSWVQARGVHAAAEGFMPGASSKAPVKSTNLAAIFAKLWFESTSVTGAEGQKLKPFGSAVVSAGLQIAFFLHTVAEEYESSLLKQLGAAIKSFFASIFKGSASASLPANWAVLQTRAGRQHKVKARQYEAKGPSYVAAKVIKQGCSATGNSVSLGVVVDVKDNNRKSGDSSDMKLKKKALKIKREKGLISSLNRLMATYTDPMTIVYAAMDLAAKRDPWAEDQILGSKFVIDSWCQLYKASSSFEKRLARQLKGLKKFFKTKLKSIGGEQCFACKGCLGWGPLGGPWFRAQKRGGAAGLILSRLQETSSSSSNSSSNSSSSNSSSNSKGPPRQLLFSSEIQGDG
ncbi:hypothetical protein Emed_000772 [Eimeria media]